MATIRFSKINKLPKVVLMGLLVFIFLVVFITLSNMADTRAENPETDFTFAESKAIPGTIAISKYIGTATDVVIPNRLGGVPVSEIGTSAFASKKLTSIKLPDDLKIIGTSAFLTNLLTTVEIPDGVQTIGNTAFSGNTLTTLTLGNSLVSIGNSSFVGLSTGKGNSLTDVTLPDTLETIGNNAFQFNKLTSLELPDSLTTIGNYAFDSNLITGKLVVPDKVTTIGTYAFDKTNQITELVLPNSLLTIGASAFNKNDLTSVVIPEGVTTIGANSFALNPNLTEVILPTTITGTIGAGSFKPTTTASSVSQVTIKGYDSTVALTTYLAVTANKPHPYVSLTDHSPATVPNSSDDFEYKIVSNAIQIISYKGRTSNVIIPDTIEGLPVKDLYSTSFKSRGLTSVVLPDSITTLGNSVFLDNKIEGIKLPKSLTAIPSLAFSENLLKELVIPHGVTSIASSAFKNNKLESVTFPASITTITSTSFDDNQLIASNLTIRGYDYPAVASAFAAQKGFTFESIGTGYEPSEESSPSDFTYYKQNNEIIITSYTGTDRSVSIPSTIENLPVTTINNMGGKAITSLVIPNSVTTIGVDAFKGNLLSRIKIPSSVISLGANAFINNKLTEVTIPSTLKDIGMGAFSNNSITTVTLEEGVGSLPQTLFSNNKISEVVLPQSLVNLGLNVFTNNQATAANLTLKGYDSNSLAKNYSEKYGFSYQSLGSGTPIYNGLLKQHKGMRARLSTNGEHTAVIDSKGDLYTWGGTTWMNSNYGEGLGLGDNLYKLSPSKVPSPLTWKYVATGKYSTFAIAENGDVYSWGKPNTVGALGLGNTSVITSPTKVEGISNAIAIASYSNHSLVLTENNELYAWGENGNGQLGLGDKVTRTMPQLVSGISGTIVGMSVGVTYSMVVTDDGTIYSWGRNYDGNLGMGDTIERIVPTKIPFLTGAVSFTTGEAYYRSSGASNVVTFTKEVFYFGDTGNIGSTIYPGNDSISTPRKVVGIDNAVEAYSSIMMYTGMVLTDTGELRRYSWGQSSEKLVQYAPTKLYDNVNNTASVALHTYIQVMPSGEICAWGDNQNGTFGNGKKTNSQTVYLDPTLSCIAGFNVGAQPVDPPADIETINKSHQMSFELMSGDLTLNIPQITSFGKISVGTKTKIVSTDFEDNFVVTDSRGTGQGWRLDVSSTAFTEVEPVNGFKSGTSAAMLPFGSLSISPLLSIDRVGTVIGTGPSSTLGVHTVIDNGTITVARANVNEGMGKFNLNFANKSLHLVVDPSTVKLDKENYPTGDTPYSATITWNLVSAP